jgi:hypothetical protein
LPICKGDTAPGVDGRVQPVDERKVEVSRNVEFRGVLDPVDELLEGREAFVELVKWS